MGTFFLNFISVLTFFQFSNQPLERHPLHVSTTEINYNIKDKSLEVTCRIFTDDFEAILASNYKEKVDLVEPKMEKAMDVLVAKYMKAHLSYRVNGKALEATYVGFEVDKEAVNVYLEINNISSFQTLDMTNSILYDKFDDQMNIVHAERAGVRKSARANYPQREMQVRF